ncbi:MAG TPA: hypothetical protein VKJ00_15775 [Thermoanaerobaculia bacterium]|nr:hypothetical protein [Thermoanaerobaculia bacterium]
MVDRRRGDRRHRLGALLFLTAGLYCTFFVWPTPWRYDHIGKNPVRTNRVTGDVEILTLQGWQPELPPLDVRRPEAQRQFRQVPPAQRRPIGRSRSYLSS